MRFDTHFFLAPLPAGQEPRVDGEECVDSAGSPRRARSRRTHGEIELVFPTIKHLEQLCAFATAADLLATRAGARCRRCSRASSSMARSRAW